VDQPCFRLLEPAHLRLEDIDGVVGGDCPGRKPPFLAAKRPARLFKKYKSAIQNRSTMENAKGA
jgi:hypothetical protein